MNDAKNEKMTDKDDFLSFLGELAADFRENPQGWENKTIDGFIEAMMFWVEDHSSSEYNRIDWNNVNDSLMAQTIYMGNIYE